MRVDCRRILSFQLAVAVLAGCGAAGPAPHPPPTRPARRRQGPPAGHDGRGAAATSNVQLAAQVLITLDGRVLTGGAVAAIFPGPLVNPITERQLGAAGWARVVDAARAAGLLGLNRDLTGGQMPPGSRSPASRSLPTAASTT